MLQMDRLTKIALMILVTNMTKVQKPDYVLQMDKLHQTIISHIQSN